MLVRPARLDGQADRAMLDRVTTHLRSLALSRRSARRGPALPRTARRLLLPLRVHRPVRSSSAAVRGLSVVSPSPPEAAAGGPQAQPRRLAASELALVPHGEGHRLRSGPTPRPPASSTSSASSSASATRSCATEAVESASTWFAEPCAWTIQPRAGCSPCYRGSSRSTRRRARRSRVVALHPAADGARGGWPASRVVR